MAKEKIGSNAQFKGGSQTLTYIGNHVYAYSGPIDVTNDENSLLLFVTGSEYIKAHFGIGSIKAEGDDYMWKIYFNGIQVNGRYLDRTYNEGYDMDIVSPMIIPPLTEVKVTMDNNSSSSSREWMAMMSGKVYE